MSLRHYAMQKYDAWARCLHRTIDCIMSSAVVVTELHLRGAMYVLMSLGREHFYFVMVCK